MTPLPVQRKLVAAWEAAREFAAATAAKIGRNGHVCRRPVGGRYRYSGPPANGAPGAVQGGLFH